MAAAAWAVLFPVPMTAIDDAMLMTMARYSSVASGTVSSFSSPLSLWYLHFSGIRCNR